ncbi:hypothetical protein B0T25DRAFT_69612 [Lasiosphaeria hispida]|uniref:Uncharacterized protein n=1 Tax=Lasiosphaeria hispida TaxID=260671 RepID=A0AAJ0HX88_9PEZI|nr:hypothetical protein B0T25DRAFT_69612 [Lasiosphaeria hispida]
MGSRRHEPSVTRLFSCPPWRPKSPGVWDSLAFGAPVSHCVWAAKTQEVLGGPGGASRLIWDDSTVAYQYASCFSSSPPSGSEWDPWPDLKPSIGTREGRVAASLIGLQMSIVQFLFPNIPSTRPLAARGQTPSPTRLDGPVQRFTSLTGGPVLSLAFPGLEMTSRHRDRKQETVERG